jgi:hypothetical protein
MENLVIYITKNYWHIISDSPRGADKLLRMMTIEELNTLADLLERNKDRR